MPRMRFVKHEFFLDDELAALSHVARLLFIGLWTLADRNGRLEDRPAKIKAMLFPYEQMDVEESLAHLACGFIERYEADGRAYIQICNFGKHQRPHVKEPPSTIPAPAKNVQAPVGRGKNAGFLVLGSGFLRVGSGQTTGCGAEAPVDFSEYRLPASFGKFGGTYVVNIPADQCQFLIDKMRPGPKVLAALRWRIAQKEAEKTPAQREAGRRA